MVLLPNPWVILVIAITAVGGYLIGHVGGDGEGAARVQQAWDKTDKDVAQWRAKRIETVRQVEQGLQAGADLERKNRDAENKLRDARLRAALRELQSRPPRPSGLGSGDVSKPAGTTTEVRGCTGAELYRDDAEFLTRKFNLAEHIRADRDTCYRQYNAAREELKKLETGRATMPVRP